MKEENLRKIINFIPTPISLVLVGFKLYNENKIQVKKNMKQIAKMKAGLVTEGKWNKGKKHFFNNLKLFCIFNCHTGANQYLDSYFNGETLQIVTKRDVKIDRKDVILICCVKNDLERIKKVVEHHRAIGIKHMVFVDNESTDGTREWLNEQEVDLYSTKEKYHAGRKGAWIRKIQDIYGYNRWYLVVDSDELFSYVGMEEHLIQDLVKFAEKRRISRVQSVLLDMYPKHELYRKVDMDDYDFVEDYRFFDKDTYYNARDGRGYMVRGGPRKRYFEKEANHDEPLSKYPLFYVTNSDIWTDHRPLPYANNIKSLCLAVLRHYKFMAGDFDKYKQIAKDGQYYNNSMNYKIYLSSGYDISFYYEGSEEYQSSKSLSVLPFLDKLEWQEGIYNLQNRHISY